MPLLNGCWFLAIKPATNGYVYLSGGSRGAPKRLAHRVFYERCIGPIPAGLTLDHLCRNRACVNPHHGEPVTRGENVLRGEGPSAQHARQTHCLNGHPLDGTGSDVLIDSLNRRVCRPCRRQRERRLRCRS